MHSSHTELEVYKKCREFRMTVSKIIKSHFPKDEKYLMTSQLLDASRSVTANIAEGHGRYYYQDNIRFCRIARGSLEESMEHLITAFDEKYISGEMLKEIKPLYDSCLRLLNGYIKYLRNSKRGKADNDA